MFFHLKDALKTVCTEQYVALNVSSYQITGCFDVPWLKQNAMHHEGMKGPYTSHTHVHLVYTGFFHPPKPIQCPHETSKQHTRRYLHRAWVFNSVLIWSFPFADRNSNLIDKFPVFKLNRKEQSSKHSCVINVFITEINNRKKNAINWQ